MPGQQEWPPGSVTLLCTIKPSGVKIVHCITRNGSNCKMWLLSIEDGRLKNKEENQLLVQVTVRKNVFQKLFLLHI